MERLSHFRPGSCLAIAFAALVSTTAAAQEFTPPVSGNGPAVVLLSGQSGTGLYQDFAKAVAELGYTAVLVHGREVPPRSDVAAANLKNLLVSLQVDGRVRPGKVAVVGFSLGGGGALVEATKSADTVAGVVAYYPAISGLPDIPATASAVRVPTLVLAGAKDTYNKCCLIESMERFVSSAKAAGAEVELVTYAQAEHGFNLKVPAYRADDSSDAWQRVRRFLEKHMPVK